MADFAREGLTLFGNFCHESLRFLRFQTVKALVLKAFGSQIIYENFLKGIGS